MSSVFTQIRKKEILGQDILYEDDKVFILLSDKPHIEGHSLIIPIEEVERFEDVNPNLFSYMAEISQKYAKVLKSIYEPDRVGMMIDGFEIDHVHLHIMPIWKEHGVWGNAPASPVPLEALKGVAEKIKKTIPNFM